MCNVLKSGCVSPQLPWFWMLVYDDGSVGFCNTDTTLEGTVEMRRMFLWFARKHAEDWLGGVKGTEFCNIPEHGQERPMGIYVRTKPH